MAPWGITLAICAVYLAVTLIMGLVPGLRVSRSVAGYVAADRSMNSVMLYFVLGASIFSSFAFLGGPGWAYGRGAAAIYIIAYGVVGMVPMYFLGPRARRLGARFGFVTQAELLSHRFGSRPLSVVLALTSIAAFVPYLTLQMKGAGLILSTVSEGRVSVAAGAAITYGVVVVYVLASGVMGVGWTNTFQGAFMMVIAWVLGLYLPYQLYGGVGPMFDQIVASKPAAFLTAPGLLSGGAPWGWAAFSSAVVVSGLGFSMWPHLFMKSYAAKSDRALRLTVVLYPTFQLFLVPILLIGFAGVVAFPGVEQADTILPYLLTQIDLSPLLVGLVCAGTLAASMSSGDALLHAAASIGVRDGLAKLGRQPADVDADGTAAISTSADRTSADSTGADSEQRDLRERRNIRILVVVLALVAYYFAVVSKVSIVALLLGAYGGVAQIFPLAFAAFYWPRATGAGALAGFIAGLTVNVVFLLHPAWSPVPGMHEGVWGLAVNIPTLIVVSLLTRPEPAERVRAYVET